MATFLSRFFKKKTSIGSPVIKASEAAAGAKGTVVTKVSIPTTNIKQELKTVTKRGGGGSRKVIPTPTSIGTPVITQAEAAAGAKGTVVTNVPVRTTTTSSTTTPLQEKPSMLSQIPKVNIKEELKTATPGVTQQKQTSAQQQVQPPQKTEEGWFTSKQTSVTYGIPGVIPGLTFDVTTVEPTMKGKAAMAVPGQYFGTIFHKQLSPEILEEAQTGSVAGNLVKFYDPRFQYKVALYNEQLRYDIKETEKLNQDVLASQEQLINLGVPEEQVKSGVISTPLNLEQQQAFGKYEQSVNVFIGSPSAQRVVTNKGDLYNVIGKSNLSPTNKFIASGLARSAETIGYLAPPIRVVLGLDVMREGISTQEFATTKLQKNIGGLQIIGGGVLAYTGLKTTLGMTRSIPAGTTGLALPTAHTTLVKVGTYGIGTAAIGGIGSVDYYMTYKKTGSRAVALGSAVGSSATLLAGLYGPPAIEKVQDWWATRGMERIRTPSIEEKPFIRETPGGRKQLIFYERAKEFKFYNPKTWKYYNYKPGEFYAREYRLIDPRVEGKAMGMNQVSYYDVVKGKVVLKTESVSVFPADAPSTHKEWFTGMKGGVQQYYLPQKYLPQYISSGTEGYGYSATPQKWQEGIPGLEKYQVYYSGKGASVYFFRIGGETERIVIGGTGEMGPKPVLYSSYFEKVKVSSAIKETVVPNPIDVGGKGWKQYLFYNEGPSGSLNIPSGKGVWKFEVEGTVAGPRTPLGTYYFFNFAGRKIPIQSGVYGLGGESISSPSAVSLLTDKSGTLFSTTDSSISSTVSSQDYSYIPTTQYIPSPVVPGTFFTSIVPSSYGGDSYSPVSSNVISTTSYIPSYITSPSPRSRRGGGSSYVPPASSYVIPPSPIPVSPISKPTSYYYKPITPYKPSGTPAQSKQYLAYKLPSVKQPKAYGKFPAYLRRFGEFKIVGYGATPSQAVGVGKQAAQYTLGATFKVPSFSGTKVSGFRTKKTKEGTLFIEPRSKRIKKGTKELPELMYWKGLKSKKRKGGRKRR